MHNYRDLIVWQKAMDLVEVVYEVNNKLPVQEKTNFGSQICRSALSIPSNIAEGAGRGTNKDFARFLAMSVGSSYELETQLVLIQRIFKIETTKVVEEVKEVQRMLFNLRKKYRST